MNRYLEMTEQLAVPDGQKERLKAALLAVEPQKATKVYRPWNFAKKALVAALVALGVTVSVGAGVLADWDDIFTRRFGLGAASSLLAANAFQEVHVTNTCDDVTLTVREVVGDSKSIDYILDYQLPDTLPVEVRAVLAKGEEFVYFPEILYFATGDVTWEDYKAGDAAKWAALDWADYTSWAGYFRGDQNMLDPYRLGRDSHGSGEMAGYDAESRTLTYLFHHTVRTEGADFTAQPLTLLASPPSVEVDGVRTALADHPALITFQPDYQAAGREGTRREGETSVRVTVSPLAFSMDYYGLGYDDLDALIRDTRLVYADGSEVPMTKLGLGYGGGMSGDGTQPHNLDWSTEFRELQDPAQVAAVRVGDLEIPLAEPD